MGSWVFHAFSTYAHAVWQVAISGAVGARHARCHMLVLTTSTATRFCLHAGPSYPQGLLLLRVEGCHARLQLGSPRQRGLLVRHGGVLTGGDALLQKQRRMSTNGMPLNGGLACRKAVQAAGPTVSSATQ